MAERQAARVHVVGQAGIRFTAVRQSLCQILRDTALFSMATVTGQNTPYVNNAFFFVDDVFRLGFLSFSDTQHIRNIVASRHAAVSVARSPHIWGRPLSGAQLFGRVYRVGSTQRKTFVRRYSLKFPRSRAYCKACVLLPGSGSVQPFYFEIKWFTLIDESRFGEEIYVRGVIRRSRIRR
jgi:uncharacterized protein YhbP (UPF0306 family)